MRELEEKNTRPPPPIPSGTDLKELKPAADTCRACPIGDIATQAVVGRGGKTARLMIVGEQPGNEEDLSGQPFVGPSGKLLTRWLNEIGADFSLLYFTNAVKHFKWVPSGRPSKPRLHSRPNGAEIRACRPWIEKELAVLRPEAIVCLGATAAQSVFGRTVRLKDLLTVEHKDVVASSRIYVTYHPSAALRAPHVEQRKRIEKDILDTLRSAYRSVAASGDLGLSA